MTKTKSETVKVGLSPSKKNCFACFNENSSKMMKKTFYFTFLHLKIFSFLSWHLGYVEKQEVNFKIYDLTVWSTNNCNTNIVSLSKDNQILNFGQLIDDNNRNIFIRKSCRKWIKVTNSRPRFLFFLENFKRDKSRWSAS